MTTASLETVQAVLKELMAAPFADLDDALAARRTQAFATLTHYHQAQCPDYARLIALLHPDGQDPEDLKQVPPLPVGLFKSHRLSSIPDDQITSWVTSSGTTGTTSRVPLNADAAALQTQALGAVIHTAYGARRLPMILADSRTVLQRGQAYNARAAGLLGLMKFGRDYCFLLDEDGHVDRAGLTAFLERHDTGPIAIFGFTFMVWRHLLAAGADLDLSRGILIHSGGWKRLEAEAVDPGTFRAVLAERYGLVNSFNFYGMAEQIGTVHLEAPPGTGADGTLRCPSFAHIIVRDPWTLAPLPAGEPGVLQVMSLLPHSYPGHSIVTEDWGVLEPGTRPGLPPRFRVLGRVPKTQARGCSDVYGGDDAR